MARITKGSSRCLPDGHLPLPKAPIYAGGRVEALDQNRNLSEDVKLGLRAKQIHAGLMVALQWVLHRRKPQSDRQKDVVVIKQRRNNISLKS